MPKAKPLAVREFVHSLYLQGMRYDTIIEETQRQHNVAVCHSLVKKWSERYGWKTVVTQTKEVLQRRVTEPVLTSQVAKQGQAVREKLADSINQASELLRQRPVNGLNRALRIQADLEPLVRNANKVFGWDQQTASTIASVQSLSSELPPDELATADERPGLAVPSIKEAQLP